MYIAPSARMYLQKIMHKINMPTTLTAATTARLEESFSTCMHCNKSRLIACNCASQKKVVAWLHFVKNMISGSWYSKKKLLEEFRLVTNFGKWKTFLFCKLNSDYVLTAILDKRSLICKLYILKITSYTMSDDLICVRFQIKILKLISRLLYSAISFLRLFVFFAVHFFFEWSWESKENVLSKICYQDVSL